MKTGWLLRISGFLVAFQIAIAVFAAYLTPYDPLAQNVVARLKGPSAAYWLGTDQFGRDVLSRLILGSQTSLLVAMAAVGAALVVGGSLGVLAAY